MTKSQTIVVITVSYGCDFDGEACRQPFGKKLLSRCTASVQTNTRLVKNRLEQTIGQRKFEQKQTVATKCCKRINLDVERSKLESEWLKTAEKLITERQSVSSLFLPRKIKKDEAKDGEQRWAKKDVRNQQERPTN